MKVARKRIARLMREEGLRGRRRRRFVRTTDSRHNKRVAANVLDRQFQVDEMNRVWAGDITYLPTTEGWLYLAVVLDLYSRRVIGWALSERTDDRLTLSVLEMAIGQRNLQPGLLHHSDRGSQYASDDYKERLKGFGVECSMSRKGDCWDNAVVESFFGTLKTELDAELKGAERAKARSAVFEYIEGFYNQRRRHSSLGFSSPAEYEQVALGARWAAKSTVH